MPALIDGVQHDRAPGNPRRRSPPRPHCRDGDTVVVDLVQFATAAGASVTPISRKEGWALLQAWREIYGEPLRAATGKWGRHAWHTFSHGLFRSLRAKHAMAEYHAQDAAGLLVLLEDDHSIAIRCTSCSPVDFSPLYLNLYIAPPSFEWTMVFTHEHPDYGPYFSRAAWWSGSAPHGRHGQPAK